MSEDDKQNQSTKPDPKKSTQPTLRLRPEPPEFFNERVSDIAAYFTRLYQISGLWKRPDIPPLPTMDDHLRQALIYIPRQFENNKRLKVFLNNVSYLRYRAWVRHTYLTYFHLIHPITNDSLLDDYHREQMLNCYRGHTEAMRGDVQREKLSLDYYVSNINRLSRQPQLAAVDWNAIGEKMKLIYEHDRTFKNACRATLTALLNFNPNLVSVVRDSVQVQCQDIFESQRAIRELANDVIKAVERVK